MLHRAIVVACVLCFVAMGAGTASATTHTLPSFLASDTRAYAFAENIVNGTTVEDQEAGYAAATTKPKDATVWLNAGAGGIKYATSYTTNGYLPPRAERSGASPARRGDLAGYAYSFDGNYSPFYLGSGGTTATILPSLTTQAAAYGINNSKQVVGKDDAV